MNLFKKLFAKKPAAESGKKAPEENAQVKETRTTETSLQIDFADQSPYPYLLRFDNNELSEGYLASVFHYDQEENPVILQAVVIANDEDLGLIDNSEMSEEMLEAMETQAQASIANYPVEFKYHPEFDQKVIVTQGAFFTCETILSEEQMLKAHVMLDAEEILVTIPRRGVMLIAAKDIRDDLRQTFLGLHATIWSDEEKGDDSSRLCKDVFVLKHGQINGLFYLNI